MHIDVLAAPPEPSLSAMQSLLFYARQAEGGIRLAASAGETLLLPAGWPHAVVTTEDTVAVGGNFLHGLDFRCAEEFVRQWAKLAVESIIGQAWT